MNDRGDYRTAVATLGLLMISLALLEEKIFELVFLQLCPALILHRNRTKTKIPFHA